MPPVQRPPASMMNFARRPSGPPPFVGLFDSFALFAVAHQVYEWHWEVVVKKWLAHVRVSRHVAGAAGPDAARSRVAGPDAARPQRASRAMHRGPPPPQSGKCHVVRYFWIFDSINCDKYDICMLHILSCTPTGVLSIIHILAAVNCSDCQTKKGILSSTWKFDYTMIVNSWQAVQGVPIKKHSFRKTSLSQLL